ncbi:hypothetical protein B0T20DRAFT_269731 [Sordaria brevicollis]|uniref:Uncharacterized protein n=1 Tax=Sordaria brevicollis TaxID=83679 RepID=A0AAE0PAN6_SORBR|nr:hypothetical protein B0T20DRAFT_269731 [Sordaria brevicollis]
MAKPTPLSAAKITLSAFNDVLGKYPSCIQSISQDKGAKPGQKTLAELDEYRYDEAVTCFGSKKAGTKSMGIDEVKTLVEWKLRHGKFRPTLMNLVSSNDPELVRSTVQDAIKQYRDKSDVSGALAILTKLKGIGPATASLLLAVHDPDHVIFFADEAFYWLCGGGEKVPLKYNVKEYNSLCEASQKLSQRLGVKAIDIERVAFVLMRQESGDVAAASATLDPEPPVSSVAKVTPPKTKRKKAADEDANEPEQPVRRSKRTKRS